MLDTPTRPFDAPDIRVAPPRVGTFEAVRRHWPLAVLPPVLLVIAAIAIGMQRSPVYTANAQLAIGRLDATAPGALTAFSTATQTLAAGYSRAIYANDVVQPVAKQLHMKPATVVARLSATPIPASPVFTVTATGPSQADAVALANAASNQLVKYVQQVNGENPDAQRIYSQYQAASLDVQKAATRVGKAQNALKNSDTRKNEDAFNKAQADLATKKLTVTTLQNAYLASQQGLGSTAMVQQLSNASTATSDRKHKLELMGLAALIAGIAIGLALATLRANRRLRRSFLAE